MTPGLEPALDPGRPIVDPHLHLWDIPRQPGLPQEPQCFLFPELLATVKACGHRITHSVFVECGQMYRVAGPDELRSLGETEFANGIAAMSASGNYGSSRLCHRIVGNADLRLGDYVRPVVEAHMAAAGGRLAGIRTNTAFSDSGLFGHPCDPTLRGLLQDESFTAAARILADLGLVLDVWCVQAQLEEVVALADAAPDLTIVVDHTGTPASLTPGTGTFTAWKARIVALAKRPNVRIKLGGLGMDTAGPIADATGPATGEELAALWGPVIETAAAAFTPARAMFESNFPPDRRAGGYGAIWNAFKIITKEDQLFSETATETYRIAR